MSGNDTPSLLEAHLESIYAQAQAEFPKECCGYIHGRGADARVVQCKNRQDQLHAFSPKDHPRTAENGYNIGGRELLDLTRSFESDDPATIIYHSHPRVGAYFSGEDTSAALSAGLPVDYLVIDAQEDGIGGAVLFRREGEGYVEVERFGAPKTGE
ncbi:MAG: Mov34/MPN/PAD-1 family protein [Nannocystales bacterium]